MLFVAIGKKGASTNNRFGRPNEFNFHRFPSKHPMCEHNDPAGKLIL